MFSRQHYIAIVKLLKDEWPTWLCPETGEEYRDRIIRALADLFEADNPNFNRDQFLRATGEEV